jgi:hypothetical protein
MKVERNKIFKEFAPILKGVPVSTNALAIKYGCSANTILVYFAEWMASLPKPPPPEFKPTIITCMGHKSEPYYTDELMYGANPYLINTKNVNKNPNATWRAIN